MQMRFTARGIGFFIKSFIKALSYISNLHDLVFKTYKAYSRLAHVTDGFTTVGHHVVVHSHVGGQVVTTNALFSHVVHPIMMVLGASVSRTTRVDACRIQANQTAVVRMTVGNSVVLHQAQSKRMNDCGTDGDGKHEEGGGGERYG